jgi:hypothetical protein
MRARISPPPSSQFKGGFWVILAECFAGTPEFLLPDGSIKRRFAGLVSGRVIAGFCLAEFLTWPWDSLLYFD